MALLTADFDRVEAANTAAKARALIVRLQAEKEDATPARRSEIDYMIELVRENFDPAELRAPQSARAQPSRTARDTSARGGSARQSGGSPAQPGSSPAQGPRNAPNRGGGPGRRPAQSSARRGGGTRATRAGQKVVREAAGHAEPVGSLVLTVLGATIAFAVVLAVLKNASSAGSGKAAVDLFGQSFVTGVRMFVSPDIDPLAPDPKGPLTKAADAAAKTPARTSVEQNAVNRSGGTP